ncbi:MAG TPA: YkgJ family cysteine cluster protein [Gemmataceae bacterium]|nr:YkgJ family cysteine cluster protein [Gemmataceae bacterium]
MFQPWYRAGLRFCCTRCGKCCTGAPGRVWVNDEEMAVIAEYQNEPLDQVVGLYTRVAERGRSLREKANGDCIFYDPEKGCTIYPVRPRQCQTWPFWESNVATPQDWQRTCDVCPGSGQGELISAEEISRRLKGFRV